MQQTFVAGDIHAQWREKKEVEEKTSYARQFTELYRV